MQTIKEFNSKYATLIYSQRANILIERSLMDEPTARAYNTDNHTTDKLFDQLVNLVYPYVSHPTKRVPPVLTLQLLWDLTEENAARLPTTDRIQLHKDFTRVELFKRAYAHSWDTNARKTYPATIPPPPAKVRKQFLPLSALKAQPEPPAYATNHDYSRNSLHPTPKEDRIKHFYQREHALINSLIETLHECTQISHSINQLGDLDIRYTRKNGTTGEAYLPHYNPDNFTPLFRNTLNNILKSCQPTRH